MKCPKCNKMGYKVTTKNNHFICNACKIEYTYIKSQQRMTPVFKDLSDMSEGIVVSTPKGVAVYGGYVGIMGNKPLSSPPIIDDNLLGNEWTPIPIEKPIEPAQKEPSPQSEEPTPLRKVQWKPLEE